ncbi:MAG: hypothetical protein Q8P40_10615 [Nitrospirota bacterium]|nr:hypothetical protein [Nitrospirota bacterium]
MIQHFLKVGNIKFIHLLLVIGFVFFLICMVELSVFATETANVWTKIQIFADNGFDPGISGHSLRDGGKVTKDTLIKRFGQPLRTTYRKERDTQEPEIMNEIITLEYPGLFITISKSDYDQKPYFWIKEIILTSPDYPLKYGLRIGRPVSAFLSELGDPIEKRGKSLIYSAKNVATFNGIDFASCIDVVIELDEKDQAKKITWKYWAD